MDPRQIIAPTRDCLRAEVNGRELDETDAMRQLAVADSCKDLEGVEGRQPTTSSTMKLSFDLTAPEEIESRLEFVTRLRRTVAWLNINDREHAVALARNQNVRARAVLHQEGARTKW